MKKAAKRIKKRLAALRGTEELVSLYTDRLEPDSSIMGYVLAVTNRYCLLAQVLDDGQRDGYTVFEMDDLFNIECGSKYEQRVAALHALQGQKHAPVKLTGRSLRKDLLRFAKRKRLLVSLQQNFSEDVLVGFVERMHDGIVELQLINVYGEEDGEAIVKLDSLQRIHCDGESERGRLMLHQHRYGDENQRD